MEIALSENITFIQNPLEALTEIISNRGYNNYGRGGNNDIMVVRLPNDIMENNSQDIVQQREEGITYLNPEYIQGYIRIGVEKGEFQDIIIDENVQITKKEYNLEDTLKSFYEKTSGSKFCEVRTKVVSLFKQLLRPKEKETEKERD